MLIVDIRKLLLIAPEVISISSVLAMRRLISLRSTPVIEIHWEVYRLPQVFHSYLGPAAIDLSILVLLTIGLLEEVDRVQRVSLKLGEVCFLPVHVREVHKIIVFHFNLINIYYKHYH